MVSYRHIGIVNCIRINWNTNKVFFNIYLYLVDVFTSSNFNVNFSAAHKCFTEKRTFSLCPVDFSATFISDVSKFLLFENYYFFWIFVCCACFDLKLCKCKSKVVEKSLLIREVVASEWWWRWWWWFLLLFRGHKCTTKQKAR